MPDASYIQTSFLGGEWSKYMQGRADHPAYRTALNLMRNALPVEQGAATRRPGFRLGGPTRAGAAAVLKEFHFNQAHSYNMEFTATHLRFWSGPVIVLDNTNQTVSTVSTASPAVVTTASAHGWATGDMVRFYIIGTPTSPAGAAPLLNRDITITKLSNTTFSITDAVSGDNIDGSTVDLTEITLGVGKIRDITTPYLAADLAGLRVTQDEDTVIIFHSSYAPRTVQSTAAETNTTDGFATFTLATASFTDGPYLDPPEDGSYLTPSGTTGTITLTETGSFYSFVATDVGRLIRLFSEPDDWASGTAYAVGDKVKYNNLYWTAQAASTGKQPGLDLTNWAIDPTAAKWTWATIATVTNGTTITATLASADVNGVMAGGDLLYTKKIKVWRLGAFSDTTGWPTSGTFHQGRLWLGSHDGNRFHASMSNETWNFAPTLLDGTVADNCGISEKFRAKDINYPLWFMSDDQGVLIGTQSAEWLIRASQLNDPITPTSIEAHRCTEFGSENMEPLTLPLSHAFVQRNKRKLIELTPAYPPKFFLGQNISLEAQHFWDAEVEEIAYQKESTPIIWARTADGDLIGCTYRRDAQFASDPVTFHGWHKHTHGCGRTFTSIQAGPSVDGKIDTISVVTYDSTAAIHYVEFMTPIFGEDDVIADAYFLDGAAQPAAAEIVTVAGVDYIRLYGLHYSAGETITAFAAGVDAGDFTVTASGTLDIPVDTASPSLLTTSLLTTTAEGSGYSYTVDLYNFQANTGTYIMEAKENYDSTNAATIDAGNFPTTTLTETFGLGTCFDATHRELVYSVIIDKAVTTGGPGVITNDSGHALWDGETYVASAANFPSTVTGNNSQAADWNYYLARKNIDTGVVTFYNAYDSTKTVPVGITDGVHTSDGTWRRYVSDASDTGGNYPILTDPRTGDAFVHMQSCKLYHFRRTDSYALAISPLKPTGNVNNAVTPETCDGTYVYATEVAGFAPIDRANIYLVPASFTSAEVTADVKLAYATFAMGSYWYDPQGDASNQTVDWFSCMDGSSNTWFLTHDWSGGGDFRLWKFTKPSAFVYPAAPTDGGIANVTPWTSTTGPNVSNGVATYNEASDHFGRGWMGFNSGRTEIQILSGTPDGKITSGTAADSVIRHTYYKLADASWGSTTIAHGYTDASFNHVSSISDAAFCITGHFAPCNTYLDKDNYYADSNYTYRWFFIRVQGITNAALDGTFRWVLVKLTWNAGAAPTVTTVIDEQGAWDATYTTYQTAVGTSGEIIASNWNFITSSGPDIFFYDPTQNAFYLSAKQASASSNSDNFFQFDATFTGRSAHNFSDPPIMKLSFGVAQVPLAVGCTYTTRCQITRPIAPQEAGAANGPALAKTRRAHQYGALLHHTQGVSFGTVFDDTNVPTRAALFKTPGGTDYTKLQLWDGIYWGTIENDYTFDSMLCWEVTRPYPTTVLTLGWFGHTQDR